MGATREPGADHDRGQGGFTLLEAVVALALVTTVVLGLAAGMLTAIRSSTSAKSTQAVDVALSAYTESLKAASFSSACPSPGDIGSVAVPSWFTSPGSDVVGYGVENAEHWDGVGWTPCAGQPTGATRFTVEVQVDTPEGLQTASGQVVVRPGSP